MWDVSAKFHRPLRECTYMTIPSHCGSLATWQYQIQQLWKHSPLSFMWWHRSSSNMTLLIRYCSNDMNLSIYETPKETDPHQLFLKLKHIALFFYTPDRIYTKIIDWQVSSYLPSLLSLSTKSQKITPKKVSVLEFRWINLHFDLKWKSDEIPLVITDAIFTHCHVAFELLSAALFIFITTHIHFVI